MSYRSNLYHPDEEVWLAKVFDLFELGIGDVPDGTPWLQVVQKLTNGKKDRARKLGDTASSQPCSYAARAPPLSSRLTPHLWIPVRCTVQDHHQPSAQRTDARCAEQQ
jgi:hypothetical protein